MLSYLTWCECADESLRHQACVVGATWAAQKVKVIVILVVFLILIFLFCLISCQVLAVLAMMMHGIWTSHEKVGASVAYQSQLVMHDPQVIDDSLLILPLLATPGTECQTAMMVESIRGMDVLEAHYFRWLQGQYEPNEMDAFGWVSCCPVDSHQIFPSILGVLKLKDRGV